jgi:hypothetical protein
MFQFFPWMKLEYTFQYHRCQIFHTRYLLHVQGNERSSRLADYSLYQTGFAESSWTYQHNMIRTVKHRTDMLLFHHSISEVFIIHQCAEFERVFHIPIFFVPIFFANISILIRYTKELIIFLLEEPSSPLAPAPLPAVSFP